MEFKEWDAVKASNTKSKIVAEVTDRTIELDGSVFPTSIKIFDKEILYKPIELTAMFGDIKGEWENKNVILTKQNNEKAVYSVSQSAENLIINACVTVEFDGLIKLDMSVMPFWSFDKDNVPRITKLYIDIPIKNEYAGLMHFWPNCESAVCLSGKVLNSHETPDEEITFPFKSYMWLGWEYGGLGFCCESDKGFELEDSNKCITITKNGEYTNMRIAIFDDTPKAWKNKAEDWGNSLNPILFTFGFQPTPVKRFNYNNLNEFKAFHLYDVPKHPIFEKPNGTGTTYLERIAKSGANWLILHEDWSVIQNYGLPEDPIDFKEFVKECHKLGLKLMVYFGYEISSLYPEFNEVCHEYLNKNANGNFVGGWQRYPMQRDFTVCYHSKYSDVMIERVKYVMDEYGVDGIYTDGTYVPWECANEAHGCGYRDGEGKLKFIYPIFAVREHVKKLYKAVHERGGIIDTHQSACCLMATLAFADSYFDGENIQGLLSKDITQFKPDTFRAEFMGLNMGIPCNFISYTSQGFTMRMISGITLLHNVYPRARIMEDIPFMEKIWKIYEDFGAGYSNWYPYWEKQDIKVDNDKVYMSFYKNNDSTMLVITSYDNNADKVVIKTDKAYTQAKDMLDGEKVKINGTMIEVPVEYTNVKIIILK